MIAPSITIDGVECMAQTEAAIRVRRKRSDGSYGRAVWIPQSVIHDDSEVYKAGDAGRLVIAQWFATKSGLEP